VALKKNSTPGIYFYFLDPLAHGEHQFGSICIEMDRKRVTNMQLSRLPFSAHSRIHKNALDKSLRQMYLQCQSNM